MDTDTSIGALPEYHRADTFESWVAGLDRLAEFDSHYQFAVGDMLIAGEEQWGDKAVEAANARFDPGTLRKWRRVAELIKVDDRRAGLTWGHHLAAIGHADPAKALTEAEKDGLSARELTVRRAPKPKPKSEPTDLEKLEAQLAEAVTKTQQQADIIKTQKEALTNRTQPAATKPEKVSPIGAAIRVRISAPTVANPAAMMPRLESMLPELEKAVSKRLDTPISIDLL